MSKKVIEKPTEAKKTAKISRMELAEVKQRAKKIQTPHDYVKVSEVYLAPSRTIPNRAVSIKEVFGYIEAGQPIPARFMANRRVVDEDMDGVLDAEVRMLDQLDEFFALRSSEENTYFDRKAFEARAKMKDTEARESQMRKHENQTPQNEQQE